MKRKRPGYGMSHEARAFKSYLSAKAEREEVNPFVVVAWFFGGLFLTLFICICLSGVN